MIKKTNIIVIGGTIAAGKSSLVGALPYKSVQELDSNDELQAVLLEKMYEGDAIAKQVFQLDMLLTRFDKYKKAVKTGERHIFDRMIFEDKLFAKMLLNSIPNVWGYYESIWNDKVEELINEVGVPEMYIILDVSWENFKDRIFARNRRAEIDNFEANESYFKELLENYVPFLKEELEKYNVPYLVIDTNEMNKVEVNDYAKKILAEKGIT